MKSSFIKKFMSAHRSVYQKTGGLVGHRALHHRFLMLRSIGRSSGVEYITPCPTSGMGITSSWSLPTGAGWTTPTGSRTWSIRPETTIQVGTRKILVQMKLPEGEEYLRLWTLVTRQNRHYGRYQAGLDRQIPILVLEPIEN